MKTIRVHLAERGYEIAVGPGATSAFQEWNVLARSASAVAIIADDVVARLHLPALRAQLPKNTHFMTFPAGESSKSLAMATHLYGELAAAQIGRDALVVAFGGGVAGDLAGFVAATWLRGVSYIQVPTTLLAAVDSSVGGKTGVNLPNAKNLIGAFHQPAAVVIDTDYLATLPARDLIAGLAESVKHGAIRDPGFLRWQADHADAVLGRDPGALTDLIARNCEIKAEVVSQDEREAGLRAILNYGHTIGHALENLLEYELRHGECVALGIMVENQVACARGLLRREDAEQIRDLMARLGLPLGLPRAVVPASVWSVCRSDKKNRGGAVNFVLLRAPGEPVRVVDVTESEVAAALEVVQPI